ncbi:MAG: HAMP domain-containing protein [Planctomycetes bacterium]|nr:HAMP domain-containing protein [Planctomycetota bacterium]
MPVRRSSLFLKLFTANLLLVCLVFGAAGVASYYSLNAQHVREMAAWQDRVAGIARLSVEHLWPLPESEIARACKEFATAAPAEARGGAEDAAVVGLPTRLTVIAADGRVLGDSLSDPAGMQNHKTPDRPEVLEALNGRTGVDVRRSETLAVEYRYVAVPVRHEGRVVGAVRVATPVVAIAESQAVMRDVLIGTVIMAIVAFAVLGLLLNWVWYAPLRRIALAARQIAAGDLAHRVRMPGSTELAQLALAINDMRDGLAGQIGTITAQRENLRQIVAHLKEGVVAVDRDGCIVVMNDAAVGLLAPDLPGVVGRRLDAVVRHAAIVDAYNQAVSGGEAVRREVQASVKGEPRHLDLNASPVSAPGGEGVAGLIVVRDVTDLARAAAMKAEFVANASHELRTPLATLRAAVDSLAADAPDPDHVAGVAAILDRHVRRLEGLIEDLLDLHSVEGAGRRPALEPISAGSIAGWIRSQFAERAAERGLALEVAAGAPDDTFASDRHVLELILRNLIDNAIKFTPAGGRVACDIRRDAGRMRLRVADTGVGIRPEDRPHLFERFFQADASRTGGAARGSGLGLAIVKHACERLGATVSIESDPGRGTTATVLVPDGPQKTRP